ncbi:hypothetical protein RhiirA4_486581 [Rhizophagus irregularis]|uniref:Uncharacterized protein n=1 Tax=Rhizophagus irregularis TaxID=588596 RepID=A0A2I1HRL3_9GLOM|nr:hypothetical protein RhiirA4_486581 [Rhizophagus irregularis]
MRTKAEWRNDAISQQDQTDSLPQVTFLWDNIPGLNASTLASFYRHQKSPRRTSMDKIIEWVEKEGNKKSVSFSDNSSSNNSSSSGSVRGSISGASYYFALLPYQFSLRYLAIINKDFSLKRP